MNHTYETPGWRPRGVEQMLADSKVRGVLIAASRDPDAKMTFIVTPRADVHGRGRDRPVAVKVPATTEAGVAVEREGRMLVALRRMPLGDLTETVPRYVESMHVNGRPVLVSTALGGRPMSVGYHQWMHTALRRRVEQDFTEASRWLQKFQSATAGERLPIDWAGQVAENLHGRWDGHPLLEQGLSRLSTADRNLKAHDAPRTAVHGDFWFGNLMLEDGRLTGVIDWEAGSDDGSPLRDLARFALSYCLYLDRHTRPGGHVLGHRGLRRIGPAPGIAYGLLGASWLPTLVRSFLRQGLSSLGVPPGRWYDVALTGVGEVAATANDDDFAERHLELLAGLPHRARRYRR